MTPNPNTTPTPESTPEVLELSANMSREDLLGYYGGQVNRITAIAEALNKDEDSWVEEGSFFESGASLHALVDKITNDPDYTPSETDTVIAKYIDADLNEVTALNSIDESALLEKYQSQTDDPDEAIILHTEAIKHDLIKHNDKIARKLRDGTRIDPQTPAPFEATRQYSNRDVKRLNGNKRNNAKIIKDIGAAEKVLSEEPLGMNVAAFIEMADRHANGEVDDETFNLAQAELEANATHLNRAANAYMLVVGDTNNNFQNQSFIDALNLADDDNRNKTMAAQRGARAAAQDFDNASGDEPSTVDVDNTQSVPVPSQPANNPGQPASPTPNPNLMPNPNPNPNTAPTPDANSRAERLRLLSLEAANARYQATMQDLVISGAKRGGMLFGGANADDGDKQLQARFNSSIQELMMLEKPDYLANPDIDDNQRAALINAYYVAKRSELSNKTASLMGEGSLSKFNKFVVKHKVAIGLGAMVVGGVFGGGVGGAILGKAVASGITKMSKKGESNLESISKSGVNAGESLDILDKYIANRRTAGEPIEPELIAGLAGINLHDQFEKSVVKARRKGILGSIATGAAWGGLVWAGGHILIDGMDYGWNGDGGVMDKLNHLDNPNGVTPWTPSAEKPWWMHGITPWALTLAGGGALAATKIIKDGKKKSNTAQRDYSIAG